MFGLQNNQTPISRINTEQRFRPLLLLFCSVIALWFILSPMKNAVGVALNRIVVHSLVHFDDGYDL